MYHRYPNQNLKLKLYEGILSCIAIFMVNGLLILIYFNDNLLLLNVPIYDGNPEIHSVLLTSIEYWANSSNLGSTIELKDTSCPILDKNSEIVKVEFLGEKVGKFDLQNKIRATLNNGENLDIKHLRRNFLTNSLSKKISYKPYIHFFHTRDMFLYIFC